MVVDGSKAGRQGNALSPVNASVDYLPPVGISLFRLFPVDPNSLS